MAIVKDLVRVHIHTRNDVLDLVIHSNLRQFDHTKFFTQDPFSMNLS